MIHFVLDFCPVFSYYYALFIVLLHFVIRVVQNSKVLFMQSDGGLTPMSRLVSHIYMYHLSRCLTEALQLHGLVCGTVCR